MQIGSQILTLLYVHLSFFFIDVFPFAIVRTISLCNSKLQAHNLNTAFEWLADERESLQPWYSCLSWLDPSLKVENEHEFNAEMPLYPISATYLPSKSTHYLNNMEPRNVQMAIDLARLPSDGKFCVVLVATDTGRIASVGTVMTVLDIDIQHEQRQNQDKTMIRMIRVTCRPEAIADIVSIVNPEAASLESRIKRSPDYLKARVQYRKPVVSNDETSLLLVSNILETYNSVCDMYLSGVGTQNLPLYAVTALKEALLKWTDTNFSDDDQFWFSLEQWQTLCNTLRESQAMILSTNRNEIMVAAASVKGGPLKLPIHEADLEPEVRRQLQLMEVQAQKAFSEMGMDPCLDFQVLLSLPTYNEKLQFFLGMISKERQRLQTLCVEPVLITSKAVTLNSQRKGAWFDDELWEAVQISHDAIDSAVEQRDVLNFNATQVK